MLRIVLRITAAPLVALLIAVQARACPLELNLGDEMRAPASFADFLTRDTTYFMIVGLADGRDGAVEDRGDAWVVDCSALPADVVEPMRAAVAFDGALDARRVREVFEASYLTTIGQRAQDHLIKPTETAMRTATDFLTWPSRVVEFSAVKRKTRRVFRSPEGFVPAVSVSQTLDSETGDLNAPVLETEVGVKRAGSEDWDFYAYNHDGDLVAYSTFPAGDRPSPRICINCHYDAGTRAIERFFP
jgi:hypothetical protein